MISKRLYRFLSLFVIAIFAAVYYYTADTKNNGTQEGDKVEIVDTYKKSLHKKASKGLVSEKKKKVKGLEGKDSPNEYAKWFNGIRTKPGQSYPDYEINYKIDELLKSQGINSTQQLGKNSAVQAISWEERGPGNVAGRTRSILVDPLDIDTWIVGSVGGGVWKTEDAGHNWTNLTINLPNLATSALGWSISNTDIIYVGTGEGFGNVDQIDGSGIWKTTNGGTSWTQLAATATNPEFENVMRLAVDPSNPNIVVAAVAPGFNYLNSAPSSGIYRTIDGGVNWSKTYNAGNSNIEDLRANPLNFNSQLATINSTTVIKTANGGQTWTESGNGIGEVGRMELAYSPTDTNKAYISAQGGASGSILYGSTDGGVNWIAYNDAVENIHWLNGQGWYDNTVAVHPFNSNRVFVGGPQLWQLDVTDEIDTIEAQIYGIDEENTQSFWAFVNFGGGYAAGGLDYGYNFLRTEGTVDDDYTSVEIRFGPGMTQKAHRFVLDTWPEFTYMDYIDVPFQVWDIDNNRQLMVSFRDHENNGTFDLEDRDSDESEGSIDREYLYLNAVAYNGVTPDPNIAVYSGLYYKNTYTMWPEAPAGTGVINFASINFSATVRINYGAQISKSLTTTNIADAYTSGAASKGIHVDHHNLVMIPTGESTFRLMNGNDGGIAFSDDEGATFSQTGDAGRVFDPGDTPNEILMGYNTTQFYGIDKANGVDRYIGGTQDNGSWLSPLNPDATSTWVSLPSGDGYEASWHYNNLNLMLESSQYNSIYKSIDGGINWNWIGDRFDSGSASAPFFTKLAKSKQDPDLVFVIGSSGVWRSDDFGDNWSLTTMPAGFNGASSFSQIKISLADPQIVWTARNMTAGSPPYVSVDGGLSFNATNYFSDVSLGRVSGFETHPTEPNTAFALLSMRGTPKILKTTNLGQTWTELSGFGENNVSSNGFPDVSVFSLLVMPYNTNIIWVGTEIGIFESTDGGSTWAYAENGLPPVSIYDMIIVNDEIVVATHGRGVWTATVTELDGYEPPVATLSPRATISGGAGGVVNIALSLPSNYDSTIVLVDENTMVTLGATEAGLNSGHELILNAASGGSVDIYVKSYYSGKSYISGTTTLDLFPLSEVSIGFSEDFSLSGRQHFLFDGLRIGEFAPDYAIQSVHPYLDDTELSALLIVPIIVASESATLSYDDVAIVEPGESESVFGDEDFWDYVVVEGSNNMGITWVPLADGYDARFRASWLSAFPNGPATEAMLATHQINLLDSFSAGDTVLIRFKLVADANTTGWGWVIDNIDIQGDLVNSLTNNNTMPTEFSLSRNFPNPFNPTTQIAYSLAKPSDVKIQVFNALGQLVNTLVDASNQAQDNYIVQWNGTNEFGNSVSSGIYFYRMEAGKFVQTYKMVLLK